MAFPSRVSAFRPALIPFWAGGVVAANVVLDQYGAPQGLLFAPLVAALVAWLLARFASLPSPYLLVGCCMGLLSLQDVGFKLTGGGEHDLEGQGAMNVLFVFGAALAAGVLLWQWGRRPTPPWPHRAGALLVLVLLLVLHLTLFGYVGVGTSHPL
ncbi:hypothetical protein [Hymenobacter lapidarius]|uniref:hypothetical protein n=1 Tax=Hymenobacter lapidarius TaxID=1908237 RepID=UPI000F791E8B|nr:hypothetical protein [Hymenobacter lapidarius]